MVTLPLTLSSMMKFFPVSSLTNFTRTPISTLSKSMVTYFLAASFFRGLDRQFLDPNFFGLLYYIFCFNFL